MNGQYWAFALPAVLLVIGGLCLAGAVGLLLAVLRWFIRWLDERTIKKHFIDLGGDANIVEDTMVIMNCSREEAIRYLAERIRRIAEERRLAEKWKIK